MVFSLARVLETLGDDFQEMVQFLLTVVDRDQPLLNPCDGLSERYWQYRVKGSPHDNAFEFARFPKLFTEASDSDSEIDDDWVTDGFESI
jgi:hypothetical protein